MVGSQRALRVWASAWETVVVKLWLQNDFSVQLPWVTMGKPLLWQGQMVGEGPEAYSDTRAQESRDTQYRLQC